MIVLLGVYFVVAPLFACLRNFMNIRETAVSFDRIWPIFRNHQGWQSTAYPRDLTKDQALKIWLDDPRKTYVFEDGKVWVPISSKPTRRDRATMSATGYMVASAARGRGIATAMCEHSQGVARQFGYKAMQFFIGVSNEVAVKRWTKMGFSTVGRLPKAFRHPVRGFVDALVMYSGLKHNQPFIPGIPPAYPTIQSRSHGVRQVKRAA